MKEIWKDIKSFEGLYKVSNLGRVKSLQTYHKTTEKILHPTDNGKGYKIVGLRKTGHRTNFYIHRLVASAFIPNPNNLKYINHKDYDRANNIASNLEWCTQKENVIYSRERMSKPRKVTRSKTGHKYIYSRNGKYRVCLPHHTEQKFNTLKEAVHYKGAIMNER